MSSTLVRSKFIAQKGFTLIEVVISIVVFAISLSVISTMIIPAEEQSIDQIQQIEAAELGQGLLNEILAMAYDHNSDMSGGTNRCDEAGMLACSNTMGPDGSETRGQYNDVDDYNGYTDKVTPTGTSLYRGYNDFLIAVTVGYDGASIGLNNRLAKRITIVITTPLGTDITFSSYKTNY